MNSKYIKLALGVFVVILIYLFFYFGADQYLSLTYFKNQIAFFKSEIDINIFRAMTIFFCVYVIVTAFSFPGAVVLTLLSGALFGVLNGTLIVSFASTVGASIAFWGSRFLFQDWVRNKFSVWIGSIDEGLKTQGIMYLVSLRLIPVVPFFVINLAFGLTKMPLRHFYVFSQIGMLPGTIAFVYAGTEFSKIDSLEGLIAGPVLISFVLMGLLPMFIQKMIVYFKNKKLYSMYPKPKKYDYNIVVIGAGSAGLVSSLIAAAVQAKVALIEKHKMGGDCLNTGCVPSKALIKTAKFIEETKKSKNLGIQSVQVEFNFSEIMERVQSVIQKIEPHDSIERYTGLGVHCISGSAKIISPFSVEVNGKILTTKNIIIATGAKPRIPKIQGLDQIAYLTSDTIWKLRIKPEKLLILGGGPIGCELAQAFSTLGVQVTIVDQSDRLLIREDLEVSEFIHKKFIKNNIQIITTAEIKSFEKNDSGQYLIYSKNEITEKIKFDQILLAVGRQPNTTGFGLSELDIDLNANGTIQVDAYLRTKFPNIYACGDVAGPYQFTHVASNQAWSATVNALFSPFKKFEADYRVIPYTTFVSPEISKVGLNEIEAREKNIPYEISHYDISDLDRAIADGCDEGFIKVLTKPNSDQILGVTIVSDRASDLLTEFTLAMKYNLGLKKILATIHAYPTMSEANKYVSGVWQKNHAPIKLLSYVKKFHNFRRG